MAHRTIRHMIENQTFISASTQSTVAEAVQQMKHAGIGTVMVLENEQLVGIFTERDALFRVLAEGRNANDTPLVDVMTTDVQTIHPDKPFGHALHMMYEGGFRHVPVVENGWPLGIVSARDALAPDMQIFESELLFRRDICELLA